MRAAGRWDDGRKREREKKEKNNNIDYYSCRSMPEDQGSGWAALWMLR